MIYPGGYFAYFSTKSGNIHIDEVVWDYDAKSHLRKYVGAAVAMATAAILNFVYIFQFATPQ